MGPLSLLPEVSSLHLMKDLILSPDMVLEKEEEVMGLCVLLL